MGRLQDRVALVTGAGSGIGQGVAERFAAEGARVVVADINVEAGQRVAASVGGQFIQVDVTSPAAVEAMVARTLELHGLLDILVNNAGIDGQQAPTTESTVENWRGVMAVNLDGAYFGMKYGIAAMLRGSTGGAVVNMSSTVGLAGFPNLPPYSASKSGLVGLTRAVAMEYAGQGVRVNAICPTVVMTPLVEHYITSSPDPAAVRAAMERVNPMPGMPTVADVAAAALFLCSDEARFITGVALPVDGGYTAR